MASITSQDVFLKNCITVMPSIASCLDDSVKASLDSFPPEDVGVDWIISETDEYGSWTDKNPQ